MSFVPEFPDRFDYDNGINAMVDSVRKANNPNRVGKVNSPKKAKDKQMDEHLKGFGFGSKAEVTKDVDLEEG